MARGGPSGLGMRGGPGGIDSSADAQLAALGAGLLKWTGGALALAVAGTDYEVPLTFGNGLTRTANAVANDLITGKAGGLTVIGGTAAGETLTLKSTAHATRGKIYLGSAQTSAYDEVNDRLGVGTASPGDKITVNGILRVGLAAEPRVVLAPRGAGSQNQWCWDNDTGTLRFFREDFAASGAGTNGAIRLKITDAGSVIIGTAALATTATAGFLYVPTCAGTPTGVPAAQAGTVALVYDTTNDKFYIYNGGWKGGAAPGVWS